MLEYLVVLLDDLSPSFCCSDNPATESRLIPKDVLKRAIVFGMKENLMIYYSLPSQPLPADYLDILETIDNVKIGSEIRIVEDVSGIGTSGTVILRTTIDSFIEQIYAIAGSLRDVGRLNVNFVNIEDFSDDDIPRYQNALEVLSEAIFDLFQKGESPCVNLITDRMGKSGMVNCGAGVSNITVAPNGCFYICPAFYYDEIRGIDNLMNHSNPSSRRSVGDVFAGLDIKNQELLALDHAPLCRICDAFHCHRCVWLNQKLTGDTNTPSHQQCVMAHIERNVSRNLELKIEAAGGVRHTIPEIDYLDPFELKVER